LGRHCSNTPKQNEVVQVLVIAPSPSNASPIFPSLPVGSALAGPVAITESATDFTLTNGVLTARVLKKNGDVASLKFKDAEMLNDKSGHAGAYWSHDTTGAKELITRITIEPDER